MNRKIQLPNKKTENTSLWRSRRSVAVILLIIIFAIFGYYVLKNKATNRLQPVDNFSIYEPKFLKEGSLSLYKQDTLIKEIDIEIADKEEERVQGLMFRKSMPENAGMLFIFEQETPQSFWMRNTYISLDILFINKQGKIVTIHRNTETLSDQSYPSDEKAMYVLELNAGYCQKHNIADGDSIIYEKFNH